MELLHLDISRIRPSNGSSGVGSVDGSHSSKEVGHDDQGTPGERHGVAEDESIPPTRVIVRLRAARGAFHYLTSTKCKSGRGGGRQHSSYSTHIPSLEAIHPSSFLFATLITPTTHDP